jgi:hypothetical protein
MLFEAENYADIDPAQYAEINNGDYFFKCDFSQRNVDTVIMENITDLKFVKCNLINVVIQPTWKTDGMCNTTRQPYTEDFDDTGLPIWLPGKPLEKSNADDLDREDIVYVADNIKNKLLQEYKTGGRMDLVKNMKPSITPRAL